MCLNPSTIMAVTFTNKAAQEMQSRIQELLQSPAGDMWCGTFHGLAHRTLKRFYKEAGLISGFTILDSDDQLRIIKRLGILTTGDEVGATGPAGIEDSNGPLLAAFAGALGLPYERLHVADDEERMIDALRGLAARNEVVVTVGGVSMGERDLVPSAAEAVGLRTLLHRVAIQPGKPVLVCQAEDGRVLMGLPGNPVSVLATAHLFLAPLLGRFLGGWDPQWLERPLAVPHRHRGKRRLFLPARLEADGLHPIAWNGSGDLYAAAHGDGLIDLEAGGEWEAGASLRFLPYLGQGPGERSLLPRDPRGGRVR